MPEEDDDVFQQIANAGDGKTKPAEEVTELIDENNPDAGSKNGERRGANKRKKNGKAPEGAEPAPERLSDKGLYERMEKYTRGKLGKRERGRKERDQSHNLRQQHRQNLEGGFFNAKAEMLQTEQAGFIQTEGSERSFKLTQGNILESASIGVVKKRFQLSLPYGPYHCDFSRSGQHILFGGHKGHIALMHPETMQIFSELQVKETVRDVQTLHNHTLYAVAQKKYTYIYDTNGVEIHCLKDRKYPSFLNFLPYHFLLVSTGETADLTYQDVSTGTEVAYIRTKLGAAKSLGNNPQTAVVKLGHNNGCVSMWTPTVQAPVVKLAAHRGQVTSVTARGNYMVTAGSEGYWKVWDLRKYEAIQTHKTFGHAVSSMDISMTGLVSVAFGSHVQIWKDQFSKARHRNPYLAHEYPGNMVSSVKFRPWEDVCAVGHTGGLETLLVPGAGVANIDSLEATPFEAKNDRRNKEVKQLLDKLQPDSIMLDVSHIGSVNKALADEHEKQVTQEKEAKKKKKEVKKQRGKNKVGKRVKKKSLKDGKEQRKKAKARIEGEKDANDDSEEEKDDDEEDEADEAPGGSDAEAANEAPVKPRPKGVGTALGRFYGKRIK